MAGPIDLKTFAPTSAKDLFEGILSHVIPIVGGAWKQARKDIETHLKTLSTNAFDTADRLRQGKITKERADFLLHMQELYLNQILLFSEFLVYEVAQRVLDAVFSVITAAFKNVTGIKINF